MGSRRGLVGIWAWILLSMPGVARADGPGVGRAAEAMARELGPDVRVGIELSGPGGSYRSREDDVFPTASAIKTAIMVELFARYKDALDQPTPGLDAILKDDHPAIAHFSPPQRGEIRKGLAGASVRRVGRVMLGSEDASNLVYNAASSVAIAALGGPTETTRRIHERSPDFAGIQVRRYMLADRKVHGDNEATPRSLAAVLRDLAGRSLSGFDAPLMDAARDVVIHKPAGQPGVRYHKDGALDTNPVTRVLTGWFERPGSEPIVYVVMLSRAEGGPRPAEVGTKLETTGEAFVAKVVEILGPRPAADAH